MRALLGKARTHVDTRYTFKNDIRTMHTARPVRSCQETRRAQRATSQALVDAEVAQPAGSMPTQSTQVSQLSYKVDPRNGLQRIKYEPSGWCYWNWEWQGVKRRIHYIQAGRQGDPVVLLVHGYGASSYHWRYNIPALAQAGYQVYAVDLLGFGYSEKAAVDYTNGEVWAAQIASFIRGVVGPAAGPVVLAGNSLGGYVSLATAATHGSDLVRAVALLNGAGPFRETKAAAVGAGVSRGAALAAEAATSAESASSGEEDGGSGGGGAGGDGGGRSEEEDREAAEWADQSWWARLRRSVAASVKRAAMFVAFQRTRTPARIREVLQMVYVDHSSIDDDLVASIEGPARDPAAAEVFFLVAHSTRGPPLYVDSLLARLEVPLLLLWGERDPWITPARAAKIQSLYPSAVKVGLDSGHCPHDDTPQAANEALLAWLGALPPPQTPPQ